MNLKEWTLTKWVFLLSAVLCANGGYAQQDTLIHQHPFSLQQALYYAKQHNVQVKNALLDIQVQQQVNREVTGRAYPQLNASGSLVYNAKLPVSLVPAEFFGGQPGTFQNLNLE